MQHDKHPLIILEIGGGKGRLAIKLLTRAVERNIPIKYFFLEPDKSQCDIAAEQFSSFKEKYTHKSNFSFYIINSTLNDAPDTFFEEFSGKIHGIISCGGPLNARIVSYEEGCVNLALIKEFLIPQGKLLCAGLTLGLFTKNDFIKNDFKVLKTVHRIINTELGAYSIQQNYVCEKALCLSDILHALPQRNYTPLSSIGTEVGSKGITGRKRKFSSVKKQN